MAMAKSGSRNSRYLAQNLRTLRRANAFQRDVARAAVLTGRRGLPPNSDRRSASGTLRTAPRMTAFGGPMRAASVGQVRAVSICRTLNNRVCPTLRLEMVKLRLVKKT
jgi:hypothetical protein